MNIPTNPELQAEIDATLKAEQESESEKSVIDKVVEGANEIRENLKAVKGEQYARLVEIGVLVHKRSQLTAALAQFARDAGAPAPVIMMIGHADASLGAATLNHAALMLNIKADAGYAKELTEWIDRITDAEQAGIESVKDQLFGDDE